MLIYHTGYSVTVMTHAIALEAGQSSQGTSEPITPPINHYWVIISPLQHLSPMGNLRVVRGWYAENTHCSWLVPGPSGPWGGPSSVASWNPRCSYNKIWSVRRTTRIEPVSLRILARSPSSSWTQIHFPVSRYHHHVFRVAIPSLSFCVVDISSVICAHSGNFWAYLEYRGT